MNNMHTKPKLVFFQYKYDEQLPAFLLIHKQEFVKCLSTFFDVTVISEDSDYQQVCDKYEPELALFESGVNHETCRRLTIENIRSCPDIPRIALHNADGFCNARAGFLSDMDHWGIETFFAISVTAAEHTPEIADNLFVWPVFADAAIFRDYESWKSIPVLFTGNRNQFYPWRRKIFKLVSERYPSLICQHPGGYEPGSVRALMMVGEDYARTINASWFVPACGTVAHEVVRKHFEIPASNACLIAERSPGLEAAGFVDMKNCVFAEESDVLDKLDHLFRHADELKRITSAGYHLVHARHTLEHRDQILQWFNLHKKLNANQRIVQSNPFEPLAVVEKSSGIKSSPIISNGLHLSLLRQGDERLWEGKYEEAEGYYRKCINYMRWMPEPKLRLALCNLYQGNAAEALSCITEPIQFILADYEAMDPDPVEWAYFIISFLCLGKLDEAVKHSRQFPWLRHPELDRARWAINALRSKHVAAPPPDDATQKRRRSMHRLPYRSFQEWIRHLRIMLQACGQHAMADALTTYPSSGNEISQETQDTPFAKRERSPGESEDPDEKQARRDVMLFFKKQVFYRNLKFTLRRRISDVLHRLERKYGYFLPYHLSEMRNDEFFNAIQESVREEEIKTALAIGAAIGKGSTESFLAGIRENRNGPLVFCICGSKSQFANMKKAFADNPGVRCYALSDYSEERHTEELERTVKMIKDDNHITSFDAVLIDSSELKNHLAVSGDLSKELHSARIVLLDDINSPGNYENHNGLLRDPQYALVAQNPGLRNGYAIFKKEGSIRRKEASLVC